MKPCDLNWHAANMLRPLARPGAHPRCLTTTAARRRPENAQRPPTLLASLESGPSSVPKQSASGPQTTADQMNAGVSVLARLAKYGFLAGLTLGGVVAAGFVGMNVYLEKVAMPPPLSEGGDEYGWDEEAEGWSGGHLGRGTDPRLGFRARGCLRSAWLALHRQVGASATPIPSPSEPGGVKFVDTGYLTALSALMTALAVAGEGKGLRLDKFAEPDRALAEIEERLAEVRERVGTTDSLVEARRGYERVWEACVAQAERGRHEGRKADQSWAGREALRVSRKAADIAARLATTGTSGAKEEARRAHDLLVWTATTGLEIAVGDGEALRRADRPAPADAAQGTGAWLSWGKRPSQVPARSSESASQPELDVILTALDSLAPSINLAPPFLALCPSAVRSTVASLLTLSSLLSRSDLSSAHALQSSTHSVLSSLALDTPPTSPITAATLHLEWLRVRRDLASIYASEVGRALGRTTSEQAIEAYRSAVVNAENAVLKFSGPDVTREANRLAKVEEGVARDSRATGAMAANLAGLLHELECPLSGTVSSKPVPRWCGRQGGDVTAAEFYRTAMKLASGLEGSGGAAERATKEGGEEGMEGEGRAWRESWENFVRVREGIKKRTGA